ncbi:hypothetical protein MVEN_00632500 [Mycena venus]|uniref:F-box domain-containing protein n=1 Tax=Mycena venus TaxID=2733690 RepID=A0A8H6YQ62_9AGAR|nr:hypothetical protein MVEN_00632500 [Mycena venus]
MAEPRLPTELLLEISSWLLHPLHAYIAQRQERIAEIATYRALSQSCRLFRDVFLPHLWAHLDSFFDGDDPKLNSRMQEITQAPYLLDHVKKISVSLHGPALNNSDRVNAFLACMGACPNLDALKIVSLRIDRPAGTQAPGAFEYLYTAFRSYSFPSVKTLVLPDILAPILSSFPDVRSLLSAKNHCPHLEEVIYGGSSRVMIGWISVATPNIQRLILRNTIFEEDFVFMRTLTNLCYLEFAHREDTNERYPSLDDCVRGARDLLSISRNPKPKRIRIKTLSGQTDILLSETAIALP